MLGPKLALIISLAIVLAVAKNIVEDELEDLSLPGVKDTEDEDDEGGVRVKRYVRCESIWSCENCNTRKFCLELLFTTIVTYYQCPGWAPYCNTTSDSIFGVSCVKSSPPGCNPDDANSTSLV